MSVRLKPKVLTITGQEVTSVVSQGLAHKFELFNIEFTRLDECPVPELLTKGWARLDEVLPCVNSLYKSVWRLGSHHIFYVNNLLLKYGRLMSGSEQRHGITYVIFKGHTCSSAHFAARPIPHISGEYLYVPVVWVEMVLGLIEQKVTKVCAHTLDGFRPYVMCNNEFKKIELAPDGLTWEIGKAVEDVSEKDMLLHQ